VNKSIRNFALSATLLVLSATPMFANMMGTNPHPQSLAVGLSLGDYASIFLNVFGL
jgi:hypothetical protein